MMRPMPQPISNAAVEEIPLLPGGNHFVRGAVGQIAASERIERNGGFGGNRRRLIKRRRPSRQPFDFRPARIIVADARQHAL